MPTSPPDNPSSGADHMSPDPSHVVQIRRHLDIRFHHARLHGLSLHDSAIYAVQPATPDLESTDPNNSLPVHNLNLLSNATSSNSHAHVFHGAQSSTNDDMHLHDSHHSSSHCSSHSCSSSHNVRLAESNSSANGTPGDVVDSSVGSSRQNCLREQMKTLDDDEKLRLCRLEMMGPYMRNKLAALENSVRAVYESQYVRTNRDGDVVTKLSHDDVYGDTLGCKNYARKCKLKANCCGLFVCCRLCHDDAFGEDHEIDRFETKSVLCTICFTEQPVAESCIACHTSFANYFCGKCRFYENSPGKKVFHCDKCNICRVGEGLGIDTFHCERCDCCVPMRFKNSHKCFDRSVHADCPICARHLFTSKDPVEYTNCGHTMHQACFDEYIKSNYQCPLCMKSLVRMDQYFLNIDAYMEQEVLPPELQTKRSLILCNDCERKSVTTFHFMYHKCEGPGGCNSYNTRVINTFDALEARHDNCGGGDNNHSGNNFEDGNGIESASDRVESGDDMDVANEHLQLNNSAIPLTAPRLNSFWELDEDIGSSECEDDVLWDDEDFMDENAEMAISLTVPPPSTSASAYLFATVGSGA